MLLMALSKRVFVRRKPTVQGAGESQRCDAYARKQNGLACDSRWQDGSEHAGP